MILGSGFKADGRFVVEAQGLGFRFQAVVREVEG